MSPSGETDERTRRLAALLAAHERARTARLDEALQAAALLGARKRPLSRLSRRLLELAPLVTGGIYTGALRPRPKEKASRHLRALLHAGFRRAADITPLFDPRWYVQRYPDIREARVNPALHYVQNGHLEQRDPSALFAGAWYAQRNPELVESGLNPIAHYRMLGAVAGLDPHPVFDTRWYVERYGAQIPARLSPLEHFLLDGWRRGNDPGPWFETSWYLERHAAQGLADPNPVIDYFLRGADQGRDPSPRFDTDWYKEEYPDVADAGMNPLFHFLAHGMAEDRRPTPKRSLKVLAAQLGERQAGTAERLSGAPMTGIAAASTAIAAPHAAVAALPQLAATNLLVVTDTVTATQHISFVQALSPLVARGAMSVKLEGDNANWNALDVAELLDVARPDMLVLSRYTSARAKLFIERARALGIPTIFHIDDDLLDVPESLGKGKANHYRDPERLRALREGMNGCDLIYASTAPLAARLKGHGLTAPIVHGDIYCSIDPDAIPGAYPSTGPIVGYMGTSGHAADLGLIAPAIESLMDALPTLGFETFGTIKPLPELARFGARVMHHGPVPNYPGFIEKLDTLGWWVGLAPLEDNAFNRCKADTKWVEYSHAGMAVVAQDLPVYARACEGGTGILANDAADWRSAIWHLLRSAQAREAQVKAAREKLRTTYSHAALCRQVQDVFEQARAIAA
ncbi:MAG: glycosyltransferase [Alphaproteobacteria bacterium]|nr:glycosyltransferase [Alphaproteobacteria bacterium]